jgi:lysophospholipase L1-like esterase
MGKLFFIGDSITAGAWDSRGGWANRLIGRLMQETMDAQFKPNSFYCMSYNLGVSGNTVPDLLDRIGNEVGVRVRSFRRDQMQLVYSIGVNDSVFFLSENKPRFTDREFEENVSRLIDASAEFAPNVSFLGLLPVDDDLLNPIPWSPGEAYVNQHVQRFEAIIASVCQRHSIPFFPLFDRWMKMPDYKTCLIDGVHPNEAGHALMADQIGEFLFTDEFRRFHSVG